MKKYQILHTKWTMVLIIFFIFVNCKSKPVEIDKICTEYIKEWKEFYPSEAFAMGNKKSAFYFEDFSKKKVGKWLGFNKEILIRIQGLKTDLSLDDRIDMRLLKRKVRLEIEKWEFEESHKNSPSLYAGIISHALTYILARKNLTLHEKYKSVSNRVSGIRTLCSSAIKMVTGGRPAQTAGSIKGLEASAHFYEENLLEIVKEWIESEKLNRFKRECLETAASIRALISHIKKKVVPVISKADALGKETYTRKLKIYTDLDITPERLEKISIEEIHKVREMMARLSAEYFKETYPDQNVPGNFQGLLKRSIEDMEADREVNQKDFLQSFINLINQSEAFIREKKIATLPDKRTLFTDLSPAHFAGAAIGGVYSAGPFDPYADTLFYLPSVLDSTPEKVKEGFYRSFNNHFNTMIISHEISPGHYLQLKIAASNPHMVRSIFAGALYTEGWATLCERITLDAGWNEYNKLTRLAHLRKRLENAIRAYISVQFHCNGWNKEKVRDFAIKTGMLAPQFAFNLWNRVIDFPFQLTSYFLGFKAFFDVYETEKSRLGDAFCLKDFCDKILYTGAAPIDELTSIFKFPGVETN